MQRISAPWIWSLGFAALAACGPVSYTGTDKIDFENRASGVLDPLPAAAIGPGVDNAAILAAAGVLVDGRVGPSGPHTNDAGFTSSAARLQIPNRISRSFFDIFYPDRRQETIAFTEDRRPAFLATPWRNGEDIQKVQFQERLQIPVTVWIVQGPFDQQRIQALEGLTRTVSIWRSERAGFGFTDVRIHNATADVDAPPLTAIPGNPTEEGTWRVLRERIGFEAGRLNIYWVNTVNGNAGTGWSNFGAQIAMGLSTGDELLVHEIGHALSLTHVNEPAPALPNFDTSNIMHNASSTRAFITEGQTVRMHGNPASIVWTLAPDVGQVSPRPRCDRDTVNGRCPAIDRRVWADGAFAANN